MDDKCNSTGFYPENHNGNSGGGGGHVIQDETGADMPTEPKLQFVGFDVTDDPDGMRTIVAKSDRPQKPQNLSPYDGETDVYQFATFIGTNYVQPEGIPMGAMRLQIATDSNFTNLVVYRTENQSSVSIMLDGTGLAANETQYYWRIQYMTVEGIWSQWSDPTVFTTEMAFSPNVILTPVMLSPTEDGTASAENALLLSSAFAQIGEPTIHQSSSWKVNTRSDAKGTDLWGETDNTTDLYSAMVDVDLTSIPADQKVYAGVQYNGANGTKSKWSPFVGFYRRPYYDDPLLGIEISKVASNASVIRYIDINGEYVTLRSKYFDTHPIYAQISSAVTDEYSNVFSLIPPTFCRVHRPNSNVLKYWISPNVVSGFKLHPAFRVSASGFLRGRYMSSVAADSKAGSTLATASLAVWQQRLATLNAGGNLYHGPTVYEDALIGLLMVFEARTQRISDIFGKASGNAPSTSYPSDSDRYPVWRGLYNEYGSGSVTRLSMGQSLQGGSYVDNNVFNTFLSSPESPLGTPIAIPGLTWTHISRFSGARAASDIFSGYNEVVGDDLALLFIGTGQTDATGVDYPGPFGGTLQEANGAVHTSMFQNNAPLGASTAGGASNIYMKLSKWIA